MRSDERKLTNIDRLDSNALFDVCCVWVIGDFMSQNLRLAKGIDKGGASSSRCTLRNRKREGKKTNLCYGE